jgi:hypothetical protein
MKQRKPLNVGDKVKYFGDAVRWYCSDTWTLVSSDDYCEVVDLMDKDRVGIFVKGIVRGIHRRQVYAVKRKKKAVKVISDERFYCGQYTDYIYDSLSAAMKEAEISGNEILELGIVARHKLGEK